MKSVWTLAKLELSRYSTYLPGTSQSNYIRIGLIFLLLLASSMAWSRGNVNVGSLYAMGFIVFVETMLIIMVWEALNGGRAGRGQQWWLLLPFSRRMLVLSKALSFVWLGLYLILFMLLLCTIHYALFVLWGSVPYAEASILWQTAGTTGGIALAILPILSSMGLLMSVFQTWWARIGTVIVFIYISMPLLIFALLAGSSTTIDFQFTIPSAQNIWLLVAAGWIFSCAAVWLSSTIGMKQLAKLRFHGYPVVSSPELKDPQIMMPSQVTKRRSGAFWALVAMEKRRYDWISRHAPRRIRWVVYALLALIAFFGYQNSGSLTDLIFFQSSLTMFSYMGIVIYWLNKSADYSKGFAHWWLAFPHSRYMLLGSRIFAYLSSMLTYWLLVVLSAGIGIALRQWLNPMSGADLLVAGRYFAENVVLMIPLAVFYVLAVQIMPAVNKHPILIIFLVPLLASYGFCIQLPNLWVMPDRLSGLALRDGPAPDFLKHLTLLYGIGVPAALIGFGLGGKYLNRYAMMRNSIWIRSLRGKEH